MLYSLIKPLLMALPAEFSHSLSLKSLQAMKGYPFKQSLKDLYYPVKCMGISFSNPVGLAAGLDKDGKYLAGLSQLGFGYIEVGTVTPRPQFGNAKPRLFRLKEDQAIINRMGFNNDGVDALVNRIKHLTLPCKLGINIGKNKVTPNHQAKEDYCYCLEKVYPYADYVTINLSSPNTPGLRELQEGQHLIELLDILKNKQEDLTAKYQKYVPLVLKISPDLSDGALNDFINIVLKYKVDGLIATNTTIQRPDTLCSQYKKEAGGLSGKPLTAQSIKTVNYLQQYLNGKIPVIGVGGIMSGLDAITQLQAGAQLLQIYSGFIYKGPHLIKDIVNRLQSDSLIEQITTVAH